MGHERLIKSVSAHSLHWSTTEEGAVDRIAAIGLAAKTNQMGEAMLRVSALNVEAFRQAILLVSRFLKSQFRIRSTFGQKMAKAAIHELLRPNCYYCGGKGHHYQKNVAVRVCPYCDGNGLHRFSDTDREMLIGGPYNHKAYEEALAYLRDSIQMMVRNTDRRLE